MLVPNVFMFVNKRRFEAEDLKILKNMIDEHNGRKIDYPSEILDTIVSNRKKNNAAIYDATITGLSFGIKKNKTYSKNKKGSKYKALKEDNDEKDTSSAMPASVAYSLVVDKDILSNNHFDEQEEYRELMNNFYSVRDTFIRDYGFDVGVLLSNAFKEEESAILRLQEIMREYPEINSLLLELLRAHRSTECDFNFFTFV